MSAKWAIFLTAASTLLLFSSFKEDWGFFGHRRINRLAVFTLPPEMIAFFKTHIEYITEHSVDPDKRRYATKHEAVRHYIDIDHWGTHPFPEVPRDWTGALMKYTELHLTGRAGDTLRWSWDTLSTEPGGRESLLSMKSGDGLRKALIPFRPYREFFQRHIMPQYYEDTWVVDCDSLPALFPELSAGFTCRAAFAVDRFSGYGILPYHLVRMQRDLTEAFRQRAPSRILRLAAEMGHYIGDAHVPLHTTENYNGQLTNQVGIHAFWESRLPELFADETYDFFVGKAEYIDRPQEYFWDIVLASHLLVDSVLAVERELSRTFPQDRQYCYEERLGLTVRTQCKEYAEAYHRRLGGMVEARMRDAVLAIGSSWYTAWIDAGQPDLKALLKGRQSEEEAKILEELEADFRRGEAKGRAHE
jgi:hypothetical protein